MPERRAPGIARAARDEEGERAAQARDIAARANRAEAESSIPFDTGIPEGFTQHVQARMKAQGEAEAKPSPGYKAPTTIIVHH